MTTLAVLSIGHQEYLLPMPKALKVVELMQGAPRCDYDYSDAKQIKYTVREEIQELSINMVRESQIIRNEAKPRRSRKVIA